MALWPDSIHVHRGNHEALCFFAEKHMGVRGSVVLVEKIDGFPWFLG